MSLQSETDGAHLSAATATAASTAEGETSAVTVSSRAVIDDIIPVLREMREELRVVKMMNSQHHRDQNRMPRTFVLIPDKDFSITEWLKNPTWGMGFDPLGTQKNFKLIFFCPIGWHWVRDRYHVISLPFDLVAHTPIVYFPHVSSLTHYQKDIWIKYFAINITKYFIQIPFRSALGLTLMRKIYYGGTSTPARALLPQPPF